MARNHSGKRLNHCFEILMPCVARDVQQNLAARLFPLPYCIEADGWLRRRKKAVVIEPVVNHRSPAAVERRALRDEPHHGSGREEYDVCRAYR